MHALATLNIVMNNILICEWMHSISSSKYNEQHNYDIQYFDTYNIFVRNKNKNSDGSSKIEQNFIFEKKHIKHFWSQTEHGIYQKKMAVFLSIYFLHIICAKRILMEFIFVHFILYCSPKCIRLSQKFPSVA